jgi:hypothetical protein
MSFQLDFEEVPFVLTGVPIAPINGRAEFTSSGDVSSIYIENPFDTKSRRVLLTGSSSDPIKNAIFHMLSASIKTTCFGRIQDALADYRSDNVASLHDWKRKNAAEMAS